VRFTEVGDGEELAEGVARHAAIVCRRARDRRLSCRTRSGIQRLAVDVAGFRPAPE
jgi:hypothetical protein